MEVEYSEAADFRVCSLSKASALKKDSFKRAKRITRGNLVISSFYLPLVKTWVFSINERLMMFQHPKPRLTLPPACGVTEVERLAFQAPSYSQP